MSDAIDKKKRLLDEYDSKKCLYGHFIDEIEHQVKSILQVSGITVNAITSRLKDRDSLRGKIEAKGDKYEAISDITDIAGIRIITYFSEDVDRVAEIVEREFDVDRDNSIDKRLSLGDDRFGYCSLHYVVKMSPERLGFTEYAVYQDLKCEIQIRSVLQHAWAEIEHDIGYKSEITIPKEIRRNFSRIAGLLEIADKEFNEIRRYLVEYKKNVEDKLATRELLDCEIDAVILETLIRQDPNVVRLNEHIKSLIGVELHRINDLYALGTIQHLNWFKVTTVRQLKQLISKYTDAAIAVASEKLRDFQAKEGSDINETISFFYLCYATLLSEHCEVEKIEQYMRDSHIGSEDRRRENATELYRIGKKLNLS